MVAAGVTVHRIFAAFNAIHSVRPESLMEMMSFSVNTHTLWLNIVFGIVGIVLLVARWRIQHAQRGRQ